MYAFNVLLILCVYALDRLVPMVNLKKNVIITLSGLKVVMIHHTKIRKFMLLNISHLLVLNCITKILVQLLRKFNKNACRTIRIIVFKSFKDL